MTEPSDHTIQAEFLRPHRIVRQHVRDLAHAIFVPWIAKRTLVENVGGGAAGVIEVELELRPKW